MHTQQTVKAACAHNRQLMLYVLTTDSECCIFTQQTADSLCAHKWQLMLYVHTTQSYWWICTEHKVITVCAHNTHISTVADGLLILFAILPRKLQTWLAKSVWLVFYFIVSQAITFSLPEMVRIFLIFKH